jgi:glutathione peroxidase
VLFLAGVVGLHLGARPASSIYDFAPNRIDGSQESLSAYRGKVVLIVNVASQCGNTPQYEGLESLYEKYRERGLVILGFPANDFGGQEPGSNAQIASYCRATWSVDFPMFEKISVQGEHAHPLYAFLTSRPAPIGGEIEWNFQKFLVGRDGQIVERFSPHIPPLDPRLVEKIEALLATKPVVIPGG